MTAYKDDTSNNEGNFVEIISLKDAEIGRLEKTLDLISAEKEALSHKISEIYSSRGWRYATRIHLMRKKLWPSCSYAGNSREDTGQNCSAATAKKPVKLMHAARKGKIYIRSTIFPVAKFTYNRLPLPYSLKMRMVSVVFRYLSPLFEGQPHYIKWKDRQSDNHDWMELGEINPATQSHDIFILSIINWDFRTQRPQHLARHLAQDRRVFYIEVDMHASDLRIRRIEENLYVVNLPVPDRRAVQPYSGGFDGRHARAWLDIMRNFCEGVQATAFKTLIVEHPHWWPLARHLSPDFRIIFDCMDDISGFSNTTPRLLQIEEDMLQNCDQLIVSSQHLYDKYRKFSVPVLIRNGGDVAHFQIQDKERPLPEFLRKVGFTGHSERIRAGYVGAIAEWFDADLVARVAQDNPDIEFHLCGAVTAAAPGKLAAFDNVFMYGEIPYQEVPAFLERMDVLLIPFLLLPIIKACDPVKFYEYSAMGKPTVTTRLPELQRAQDLAFFADNAEEFAQQIRLARDKGRDPAFKRALLDYVERNTWADRAKQLSYTIDRLPKVSVIILSYGDPQWTIAALKSLTNDGGHYPNLEIIVVDNGSSPEWLLQIRAAARTSPNVTVIENGRNLGFAKGNNVGIKAATGDYVFLLNNDAYVAPGAIHAMVRHLENNPQIGVVGPLTNNIGNEAKVFVEYANMDEMRRAAWELTTGYRGQFTPLRVLAYFAVMFRKADLDNLFGHISEEYGRGMFEDDDHCAMIRSKGYLCALAEDAFVHHHLSATFNTVMPKEKRELFETNKRIFEAKWGAWIPHVYRKVRPQSQIDAK